LSGKFPTCIGNAPTLTHGSARCPAGSGCRTLKTPGEPSIRCCLWQSMTSRLMLAVAHPNRAEGDLRARVGLPAVLRQAAPMLLFAIEPPEDDTQIDRGDQESQRATPLTGNRLQESATRSLVAAREVWAVEEITDAPRRRSGSGMRATALIVITVRVIAGHWCLLLLITVWSNAPTLCHLRGVRLRPGCPQTRPSTGGWRPGGS
jgi:hypothetical protein